MSRTSSTHSVRPWRRTPSGSLKPVDYILGDPVPVFSIIEGGLGGGADNDPLDFDLPRLSTLSMDTGYIYLRIHLELLARSPRLANVYMEDNYDSI